MNKARAIVTLWISVDIILVILRFTVINDQTGSEVRLWIDRFIYGLTIPIIGYPLLSLLGDDKGKVDNLQSGETDKPNANLGEKES